jgi:dynein heavy chain
MWIHESRRVFGDRLIDNKDRGWIDDLLLSLPGEKFKLTKEEIMNSERLLFGDYMDGIDDEARVYK